MRRNCWRWSTAPRVMSRLSDALAGALTVVRFGEMFGTDPAPAIAQATKLLEGLEQLSRMPD